MELPINKLATPVVKWDPAKQTAVHYIVVRFYDSIATQRRAGTSWYAIAQLLTQAGNNVKEKSLQKHFLREEKQRGCGNAA